MRHFYWEILLATQSWCSQIINFFFYLQIFPPLISPVSVDGIYPSCQSSTSASYLPLPHPYPTNHSPNKFYSENLLYRFSIFHPCYHYSSSGFIMSFQYWSISHLLGLHPFSLFQHSSSPTHRLIFLKYIPYWVSLLRKFLIFFLLQANEVFYGLNYIFPKFMCWSLNTQGLRMWLLETESLKR